MNEMNGAAVPEKPPEQHQADPAGAAVKQATDVIEGYVKQVVGTSIRGMLVSVQGMPPDVFLAIVAKVTGNLCAGAIQGDVAVIASIRKKFQDSFSEGVRKAPLLMSGQIPSPPG